MTATQHSTSVDTDSLPQAIRRLEAAAPGDLALAPGGSPCAMKMEHDSGRPWLLDPWGHDGAPSRATTAAIAQMGYRTAVEPAQYPADENPDGLVTLLHLETLRAAGWTVPLIAKASGVSASSIRNVGRGNRVDPATRVKILAVDVDTPITPPQPSGEERLEDIEFLLDCGTSVDEAVRRCGFASARNAQRVALRAGRLDLRARLQDDPEPIEQNLDEYDPYDDPEFS